MAPWVGLEVKWSEGGVAGIDAEVFDAEEGENGPEIVQNLNRHKEHGQIEFRGFAFDRQGDGIVSNKDSFSSILSNHRERYDLDFLGAVE